MATSTRARQLCVHGKDENQPWDELVDRYDAARRSGDCRGIDPLRPRQSIDRRFTWDAPRMAGVRPYRPRASAFAERRNPRPPGAARSRDSLTRLSMRHARLHRRSDTLRSEGRRAGEPPHVHWPARRVRRARRPCLPAAGQATFTTRPMPWPRDNGRSARQAAVGGQTRRQTKRLRPPSTRTRWPVMKPASSEARKPTTWATSSGVPMRPVGTDAR